MKAMEDNTTPKNSRLNQLLKISGVIFLSLAIIFAIILFGQERLYARVLYPGTKIAGVNLGELSRSEARDKLENQVTLYTQKGKLEIWDGEKSWSLNPQDIDVKYKLSQSIKSVDIHQDRKYQFLKLQNLFGKTFTQSAVYKFDTKKLEAFINSVDQEATMPYQNASLNIDKNSISLSKGKVGLAVDKIRLKNLLLNKIANLKSGRINLPKNFVSPKVSIKNLDATLKQVDNIQDNPITLYNANFHKRYQIQENTLLSWLSFEEYLVWQGKNPEKNQFASSQKNQNQFFNDQKILHLSYLLDIPGINYGMRAKLDENKLNQFIREKISQDLNQEPVNVKLAFSDGVLQVLEPEKNGWKVDEAKLKAKIEKAIDKLDPYVKIELEEVLADARQDNLDELGIKKLISTGASSFAGSPNNRIFNIKLGAAKFNGVLIRPGEIFSFNDHLGKVDGSTGFLPELVIKANKTIPEFGGGLCQVSTTTFRAALNAGLPIIERKNHAYPVRYYKWPFPKHGTDATIYPGASDLKFKNDTGYWILIQTRVLGSKLYYDFFGNWDRERRVELDLSEYDYGWKGAGSLRATLIYRVFEGDKLIREQKIQSNYKSPNDFPHPVEEKPAEPTPPAPEPPPPTPPEPPPTPPGGGE